MKKRGIETYHFRNKFKGGKKSRRSINLNNGTVHGRGPISLRFLFEELEEDYNENYAV